MLPSLDSLIPPTFVVGDLGRIYKNAPEKGAKCHNRCFRRILFKWLSAQQSRSDLPNLNDGCLGDLNVTISSSAQAKNGYLVSASLAFLCERNHLLSDW